MEAKLKQIILENRRWTVTEAMPAPCNCCGYNDFRRLAAENGLAIVECRRCRLVSVNPRPTDRELERFYRQYLQPGAGELWRRATGPMLRRDADRLNQLIPRPGQMLDVGCGFGFFLDIMRAAGWSVHGCDLSETAVAYARDVMRIPDVTHGAFDRIDWEPDRFDLISFWYVMHHLADPKRALLKAHEALLPGGLIAVRVPNLTLFRLLWWLKRFDSERLRRLLMQVRKDTGSRNSPFNVLDPPVHLYGFTRKTLGNLLRSTGFRVIAIHNDGMVQRGTRFNRLVDQSITRLADLVLDLTGGALDLSISFSIYARREDAAETHTRQC
jgi:2-polyprenyl-3-methyl-5-hydroxy-6-metoxy-1,4-benzoquinol methylase